MHFHPDTNNFAIQLCSFILVVALIAPKNDTHSNQEDGPVPISTDCVRVGCDIFAVGVAYSP